MNKHAEMNWGVFAILYGIVVLCLWVMPKAVGVEGFGFFMNVLLTLCAGGITYIIVNSQS